MFQRTGSGSLLMKPRLQRTWMVKRRQRRRSLARASTWARTLARAGAKASLATPLALALAIAEARVRAAHVEAVCVFRARATIRAAARTRMPHCPRRLATTSLGTKTKGASAGHPFECGCEAEAPVPRSAQSVLHAAIGCLSRKMERTLLPTTTALCEVSKLQGRSFSVEASGWCD